MKIIVTDADEALRSLFTEKLAGHEIVYTNERISMDFVRAHADAQVLSVFVPSAVTPECIDALPNLKLIAARSTGVDHINLAHAKEKGVAVSNVAKYGARTVAEFAFGLLLNLSRRFPEAIHQVKETDSFDTAALGGFDLFGKTIGVVGTGAIGRNVVRIAQGFGMRVLMFDKFPDNSLEKEDTKYVSLDELLAASDVVTLHVPYVPENHHLLNGERLSKMKQGAYVINTARGELIDTEALLDALRSGRIAGAGLDVLEGERSLKDEMELVKNSGSMQDLKSIIRDHMLVKMPRVVVTPHIAFFSKEAYHEILQTTADNILGFMGNTPRNIVS